MKFFPFILVMWTFAAHAQHNSRNSLDWRGTYAGVLPCADCGGVETMIILTGEHSFVKTMRYLGKKDTVFVESGTFEWSDDGNHVALVSAAGRRMYFGVGENRLVQYDMNKKRIAGPLAEMYVLHKTTAGKRTGDDGLDALLGSVKRFRDAYNSGDTLSIGSMYAEDAMYVSPHVPSLIIRGKRAIVKNFYDGFRAGGHIDSIEMLRTDIDGTTAYLVTKYTATNDGTIVSGRNIIIAKWRGGQWIIVTHASVI